MLTPTYSQNNGANMNIIATLLFAILVLVTNSFSEGTDIEQKSLKGYTGGLDLLIENLNDDAELISLTENQLRTDSELRLRLAGFKLYTKDEYVNINSTGTLYINVNIIALRDDINFVYGINVNFTQWAKLLRNDNILVPADTWRKSTLGIAHDRIAKETIREAVKDCVDAFINDFLVANPR